jgi:hypothetical protein
LVVIGKSSKFDNDPFYQSVFWQFFPSEPEFQILDERKARFLKFGVKVGELLGGDSASVLEEMNKIYDLQVKLSNVGIVNM